MSNYNLFLDDLRTPATAYLIFKNERYLSENWIIVRSYDEFIDYVTKNGLPEKVSFDHDLADEHYIQYVKSKQSGKFDYATIIEKTGMECVKWMVNYCIDNNIDFPIWYLHTQNNVGYENMKHYILSFIHSKQK